MPRRALAAAARSLTLFRFVAVPPFAWLLLRSPPEEPAAGGALILLYVAVAVSDLSDGPLARRARAASVRWGRIDVAADVTFNVSALAAAAAAGVVGPWVPAVVAVLGARFLWRTRDESRAVPAAGPARLRSDVGGKLAGVLFYLVSGAAALHAAGVAPRGAVARFADAAAAYGALLLVWGMISDRVRGSRRATPRSPAGGSRRIP
ncbi:MAG: hypothetical protein QOD06_1199 [Candidatus Binatota bacterium]|nr:hypothetical protein [Candidatus Binatota bacterium]